MKCNIAENPSTPIETLVKLSHDSDSSSNVAANPSIPHYLMQNLSNSKSEFVRIGVARNPKATAEILRKLAKDTSDDVRDYAAYNPNLPEDCYLDLAGDYTAIASNLLRHSNLGSDVLSILVEKLYHPQDLQMIAEHPNATSDVLDTLVDRTHRPYCRYNYRDVYTSIISNPNTTYNTLVKLMKDKDSHYDMAKLTTNSDILDELSQVCLPYIKVYIAKNPNTSPDTLARLYRSRNPEVKQAVLDNPNYRKI